MLIVKAGFFNDEQLCQPLAIDSNHEQPFSGFIY
jgi:hypothetical protein